MRTSSCRGPLRVSSLQGLQRFSKRWLRNTPLHKTIVRFLTLKKCLKLECTNTCNVFQNTAEFRLRLQSLHSFISIASSLATRIFDFHIRMYTSNLIRFFFLGVVISAKFHDDLWLNNNDFSKIGGISPEELFMLEIFFLKSIKFQLKVSFDEFLTYLRNILIKWIFLFISFFFFLSWFSLIKNLIKIETFLKFKNINYEFDDFEFNWYFENLNENI